MKIDVVASLPHYLTHMLPIFDALPAELRGDIHPLRDIVDRPLPGRAALVAGWQDVVEIGGRAPMIYVEHGAGQTYTGDDRVRRNPGYSGSGGERHHGVIGFISPRQVVADRWRTAPAIAAGCPKLDYWWNEKRHADRWSVCFAWHWPGGEVCPEASTAWPHYADEMPAIVEHLHRLGFDVYGHAHPRWRGQLDQQLHDAGLIVLEHESQVFDRCETLFVDNSSLGAEFLALGRPVVWLNAPWFRRDVEHGDRFWTWPTLGMSCDSPLELIRMQWWEWVNRFTNDESTTLDAELTVGYANMGHAAEVAAAFIVDLIGKR